MYVRFKDHKDHGQTYDNKVGVYTGLLAYMYVTQNYTNLDNRLMFDSYVWTQICCKL